MEAPIRAVSYTHLDVYKRQALMLAPPGWRGWRYGQILYVALLSWPWLLPESLLPTADKKLSLIHICLWNEY